MYLKKCFVNQLRTLKESSKEAVENLNSFSEFKKYMHVKRSVEDELLDLLDKSSRLNKSQLILVCGGVGDGKSHLISYLKDKFPSIIYNFRLHNDATESFEPHKTSIDTLNDVLDPFSDHNLQFGSPTKLILAINLGALNNFIDSEYKYRFQSLINYVKDKKILESAISNNNFDLNSNFQFINFSDYHMFSLTQDGPKSQYITDIIKKITAQKDDNIFYKSYKQNCIDCVYSNLCPVKDNFEMLMKDRVQSVVVDILIEAIVKKKIIISTRSLLNFVYDIIVNSYLDNLKIDELLNEIKNITFENYIDYSLVFNIYEHEDLSNILGSIAELDPVNLRDERLDNLVIKLNITDDLSNLFNEYLELDSNQYLSKIVREKESIDKAFDSIKLIASKKELKSKLIKFFIRYYKFLPKNDELDLKDYRYISYMEYLYYWNKGEIKRLSKLYAIVKSAIYKWNGENRDEYINLFIGKNQTRYRISQKLTIEPYLANIKEVKATELYKFIPKLTLEFIGENTQSFCAIDIDYNLFCLLQDVENGYRPNKKDKYNFINFVEFIRKIMEHGNQDKELIIEDKIGSNTKLFRLSYQKTFDEYKFTELRGI